MRRFLDILPRQRASLSAAVLLTVLTGCAVPQKTGDTLELQRQLGSAIARCALPTLAGQKNSPRINISYSYHHGDLALRTQEPQLKQKIMECLPPLVAMPIDLQGNVEIWPAP